MKRRVWVLLVIVCVVVLHVVGTLYRDYTNWFDYDRSVPLDPRISLLETADTHSLYEVRLASVPGADIVGLLSLPDGPPPHPLIIVQGGYHRGKEALKLIDDKDLHERYALFSMDYRYTGSQDNPVLLYFQVRGALRDAVIDLRRALDYLGGREDLDSDRFVMVGVSLGALFGPILAGVDGRIDYLTLIYGGGNLREVVRANAGVHPILAEAAAQISAVVYAPFEPLRYADRISPRPLLMIHGTGDEWVPARCAQEFYDKAGEPKEIIWHDRGHIRSFHADEIARLVDECLTWIDQQF